MTLVGYRWLCSNFPKLEIHPTDLKLRSYCEKEFLPMGFVKVKVKDSNTIKMLNMYVVEYDRQPLVGRKWINQLQILGKLKESLNEMQSVNLIEQSSCSRLKNLLEKYSNVTREDFTPIKNIKVSLNLKANAQPVFLQTSPVSNKK